MTSRTPRIAVVLPVYNGEKYIAEAIQSVLSQTFTDFELLVIDDGSTDRTREVLSGFTDARMRVIHFPAHRGLVPALNTGIRGSRSEFIARMDADDICMPQRFERQVAFLRSHVQIGLCGTWTRSFGDETVEMRPPIKPEDVRARLFFGWAIDHPSILMRRDFLEQHGLMYDDRFQHVEDFDFFIRAAEVTNLANVPEVLLHTRAHPQEVSVIHRSEQLPTETRLLARQLRSLIPDATQEEESFHLRLLTGTVDASTSLTRAGQWLVRLDRANQERSRYDQAAFRRELGRKLYDVHMRASSAGVRVLASYWKSPLAGAPEKPLPDGLKLVVACLLSRPLRWRRACRRFFERRERLKGPR
jgi:glycosyltransferase involved in cell wall biosynthesis